MNGTIQKTTNHFLRFLTDLAKLTDEYARERMDGRVEYEVIESGAYTYLSIQFISDDSDEEYPEYQLTAAGFYRQKSMVQLSCGNTSFLISSDAKLLGAALTHIEAGF